VRVVILQVCAGRAALTRWSITNILLTTAIYSSYAIHVEITGAFGPDFSIYDSRIASVGCSELRALTATTTTTAIIIISNNLVLCII